MLLNKMKLYIATGVHSHITKVELYNHYTTKLQCIYYNKYWLMKVKICELIVCIHSCTLTLSI